MKASEEITNAIKNIKYYITTIEKLTKEQFNFDLENTLEPDADLTVRLNLLGAMAESCFGIGLFCEQIKHYMECFDNAKIELKPQPEEKIDYTLL